MHYDYFEFQHTFTDEERVEFLRQSYEKLLRKSAEGSWRRFDKLLKFLAKSEFYTIPCRHHQFVGGNAWHQLETFIHAVHDMGVMEYPLRDEYLAQMPRWKECDPSGISMVCLLHDLGNVRAVHYPDRIMKRHGRRATYVIVDHLKYDLMMDESDAIIHHQEKTYDQLEENTPTEEDLKRIWDYPMYQMIRHCDELSCTYRMTEAILRREIELLTK